MLTIENSNFHRLFIEEIHNRKLYASVFSAGLLMRDSSGRGQRVAHRRGPLLLGSMAGAHCSCCSGPRLHSSPWGESLPCAGGAAIGHAILT